MLYSAENWTEATNLKTAVERLQSYLSALSWDILHAMNYDLSICYDENELERCKQEQKRYNAGDELCEKFMEGALEISDFCEEMLKCDLKRFLCNLTPFLPNDIIEKYQIYDDESEEENIVDTPN